MARKKLSTVIREGDLRASLEALRDRLAAEVEVAEGTPLASLAKQLSEVLKAIAALPSEKERSIDDDLADLRRRRAETGTSEPAGRRRIGR